MLKNFRTVCTAEWKGLSQNLVHNFQMDAPFAFRDSWLNGKHRISGFTFFKVPLVSLLILLQKIPPSSV